MSITLPPRREHTPVFSSRAEDVPLCKWMASCDIVMFILDTYPWASYLGIEELHECFGKWIREVLPGLEAENLQYERWIVFAKEDGKMEHARAVAQKAAKHYMTYMQKDKDFEALCLPIITDIYALLN